jgi:hypothetical protein
MPAKATPPTDAELKTCLGAAESLWIGIIKAVEERFAPLDRQWKPSKAEFGRMCQIQHKKRTLLYLRPEKDQVFVAVILGERAYGLAMASTLPDAIKDMLATATPYVEGRGIRFTVSSANDIPTIVKLVQIKTTPK